MMGLKLIHVNKGVPAVNIRKLVYQLVGSDDNNNCRL